MTRHMITCALVVGAVAASATLLSGQQTGLTSADIAKSSTTSWPTYHGDYSGRRFSTLTKVDATNVQHLSLAWMYDLAGGGGGGVKATPLMVDGVLYFSTPDNAYAVEARTGRELWHFTWTKNRGGIHIGNRGMAVLGDSAYFVTPDCNLVSLDIKTGTERWSKEVCALEMMYFGSVAPVVVKDHLMAGVSGDDLDVPGYLDAHDPETGELQWRWYSCRRRKTTRASSSWPNLDMAKHGGGMTWQPVTYDPDLNLVYVTTGNPQPVIANANRAGANLYTASIVALNADTGKMAWYFQSSPHDTHDWDATETPVLFDGDYQRSAAQAAGAGVAQRQVLRARSHQRQGARLDASSSRRTGRRAWTTRGADRNPAKGPQKDGALVTPNQAGATNWYPPAFSPQTGLFYVNATRAFSVYYVYDASDNPMGWGGNDRGGYSEQGKLTAVDYQTGKIRWSVPRYGGSSGLLATAGNLVFGSGSNGLEAYNATTGAALWSARIGSVTNGPITYELDGLQYVVAAAGSRLVAFVMNP